MAFRLRRELLQATLAVTMPNLSVDSETLSDCFPLGHPAALGRERHASSGGTGPERDVSPLVTLAPFNRAWLSHPNTITRFAPGYPARGKICNLVKARVGIHYAPKAHMPCICYVKIL